MPSVATAPRAKIFDSLVLELSIPLRLQFDLFDFSLAQRWASLTCAYDAQSARAWKADRPSPYQTTLQRDISFLLRALCDDQRSADLLARLETREGAFTRGAIDQIRSSPLFLRGRDARPGSYRSELFEKLVSKIDSLEKTLARSLKGQATIALTPVYPTSLLSQPFEGEDFLQFRHERLAGGLRLNLGAHGQSAVGCAESSDIGRVHVPPRHFNPGFRADLAASYPTAEHWDTHLNLLQWARKNRVDLADRRNWANCVYVARLCAADLARIDHIAQVVSNAPEISLNSLSFLPANRRSREPQEARA